MGTTLPGEHYCLEHQGNTSHYAKGNCTVCSLELELKELRDTLDTYWVNNVNKLRAEHKALLSVLERSEEYIACLDDSTAMGYDGATTRTVWRQAVEKARATLNA